MRISAMAGRRARVMTAYYTKDALFLLVPVLLAARANVSGIYPFGLSSFAALAPSPVGAIAMMLGAASLGVGGIKYIICSAIYLAIGYIKKFDRVAAGTILGGIAALCSIGEMLFFEPGIMGFVTSVTEGVATGLLFYIFGSLRKGEKLYLAGEKREQIAAKLLLVGAAINGFSGIILPPGIMLNLLFGFLAVMLISGSMRLGDAVTVSLLVGYMSAMNGEGILTVVCIFAATALFSAILSELGRWAPVLGLLTGSALVLLADNSIYKINSYIGAVIAAVLIYSLLPEFIITWLQDKIRHTSAAYSTEEEHKRLASKIKSVTKQHNDISLSLKRMNEELILEEKRNEKEPLYSVSVSVAERASGGGTVSGDCFMEFDSERGRHYVILCDGMGSGRKAYKESKMTTELLREFLRTGFLKDKAVSMLNSALAIKGDDESFSTVDLFEFDAYTGDAEFLKIGSAESFIRHKNEVETLTSSSLPIGILDEVRTITISRKLFVGDIIVMVSDGVGEAGYGVLKGEWIKRMIKTAGNDTHRLSEEILAEAVKRNFPEKDDDMTVAVMRIERVRRGEE
ncbi:MAG: SpoIIE family protein phosphatase [Clostridia bacterium]|nr:SpoIIE family protein phosphatase [Clostridia bacterium]